MYGRQSFSMPRLTSFVKGLLATLLASYVVQLLLENWQGVPLRALLSLNPGQPQLWQFLTYILVDARNPLMFLFGLLVLWWVLSPFELGFGAKRTAQLCLACTLGAAVPAWALGALIQPPPPLFGSGPLWMGSIAAATYLYKDRPMSLWGLGTMTSKQFLLLLLGLSFLTFLFTKNHTHFIADLGGMAGGIGFIHYLRRPRSGGKTKSSPSRPRRGFRVIEGGGGGGNDRDSKTWLN